MCEESDSIQKEQRNCEQKDCSCGCWGFKDGELDIKYQDD